MKPDNVRQAICGRPDLGCTVFASLGHADINAVDFAVTGSIGYTLDGVPAAP